MKRHIAAFALLSLMIFSGCNVEQDYSLCPPVQNVNLLFTLEGYTRADNALTREVTSVDLILFDNQNRYVTSKRLEYEDLLIYPGTTLQVSPGEYRVVCWGNKGVNSTLTAGEQTTLGSSCVKAVAGHSGCPLWYAPSVACRQTDGAITDHTAYTVIVPDRGTVVKELEFARAHRRINVYISGFEGDAQTPQPYVEVTNMAEEYDFYFTIGANRRNYIQQASVDNSEADKTYATFTIPFCRITDDMHINIKMADGTVVTPVNIAAYIEANNIGSRSISASPADYSRLDVYIKYSGDGSVTVSPDPWKPNEVDPDW